MAQLAKAKYTDLPPFDHRTEVYLHSKQCKALEKLFAEGRAIRFQVADGYACYLVRRFKPLVLQHIQFGDDYEISDATIRGLRRADVEAMIAQELAWRKPRSTGCAG